MVTVYEEGFRGVKCRLLVPITSTMNNLISHKIPPHHHPAPSSSHLALYEGLFRKLWNLLYNGFLNNRDQSSITEIKTADPDSFVSLITSEVVSSRGAGVYPGIEAGIRLRWNGGLFHTRNGTVTVT